MKIIVAFEQGRTGNHGPKSVTVVLSEGTLVITLHNALSPAEKALARTVAGAAQIQESHRQLFANSADSLRQEIKRTTGMEVREAVVTRNSRESCSAGACPAGNEHGQFLCATRSVTDECR